MYIFQSYSDNQISASGNIIWKYCGSINQQGILDLSEQLKTKLSGLNFEDVLIRKLFSIFIECSQNVVKYGLPLEESAKNPEIAVILDEQELFFEYRCMNLCHPEDADKAIEKTRTITGLSLPELKEQYIKARKAPRILRKNSAGLGIIDLAIHSGNNISLQIEDAGDTMKIFDISIRIKKFHMNDLVIEATKSTPEIKFSSGSGILEINGNSYPENPFEFYEPAVEWIENAIKLKLPISLIFRLNYYNTSSSKQVLDIIDLLEDYFQSGGQAKAVWCYRDGDQEQKENGEDFFEGIEMPNTIEVY